MTPDITSVTGFKHIRLLDLSNCKIDSWYQILNFGDLPTLAELILDSNPLPSVIQCPAPRSVVDGDEGGCVSFPSLQRLSLSCTKLSAWSDLDHLASYRTCAFMRLSQVPLFVGKGASEVRPLVIGRMPSLVFFNGSAISPRERTDAEKSYLRSIIFAIDDARASGTHRFHFCVFPSLILSDPISVTQYSESSPVSTHYLPSSLIRLLLSMT